MPADACQSLRDQVNALEAMIESLQEMLHEFPGSKAGIIKQIRENQAELRRLRPRLAACEESNPEPQPSTNFVLTTETCPICTPEKRAIWQHVVDHQLGVDGTDVFGHWIGEWPAERFGILNVNNWYPLAEEKRVLCGELHHFNFYDGIGDEADWNNFMIPTPAFAHLLELPKQMFDPNDEWHSCDGTHDCMEAEITPDQTYYENFFNSKASGSSTLEGQTICTYGPWIREAVHNDRPEIHTSELYWWRARRGRPESIFSGFSYYLMQLQDDSNRFDREENFDFGGPFADTPSGWHAWSENPRTNRFRIAFELDPDDAPMIFKINQVDAQRVKERWEDQDPGKTHALEYNGKVVLRVEEMQPVDKHIGVAFSSVCRNAENTRLQGYVALISTVGDSDRSGEGYLTLRVDVERPPLVIGGFDLETLPVMEDAPSRPDQEVVVRAKRDSLRRVEVDGRPQLVGDVEVTLKAKPDPATTRLGFDFERVEMSDARGRRTVEIDPTSRLLEPITVRNDVQGLPALEGAQLEITTESGTVIPVETPEITLTPQVRSAASRAARETPGAWQSLAAAVGGEINGSQPPAPLVKVDDWEIAVTPAYAPVRNGKPHLEDDSPFSEELNEAILRRDSRRMVELLGSEKPFDVTWSFKATNMATGAEVPVKVGESAGPSEVFVETLPDQELGGGIRVEFPSEPDDAVIEVVATAHMTDELGMDGDVEHRVWSHVLTIDNPQRAAREILPTVASLAGVASDDLMRTAGPGQPQVDQMNDDPRIPDRRSTVAEMVRLYALSAAEDQRVTPGELRTLVRGAKLFGNT